MTFRGLCGVWLVFLLALCGCDGTIDITIETPEDALSLSVSDQDIALPEELKQGATVASVPCGDTIACPSALGDFALACVNQACDPQPLTIELPVGDVVDFEQLNSELKQIAGDIEAIQIDFVRYRVTQNDLNLDLGPVELAWGPAQASGFASPGVFPLGRIERWDLGQADVDLHDEGNRALSDFLVHTARQIRVFARTEIDVDPGQPLPMGAVSANLQLSITVTGRPL